MSPLYRITDGQALYIEPQLSDLLLYKKKTVLLTYSHSLLSFCISLFVFYGKFYFKKNTIYLNTPYYELTSILSQICIS